MIEFDEFSKGYLKLTLEIDKHLEGYVDSYYGPDEIKAEVAASEKKTPAALIDDLNHLYEHLPAADPQRREYLKAVMRAMECSLRTLNGETFEFLDEAYRLFDLEPQKTDEARFTAAHAELDRLLPGTGSLTDRLEAWKKQFEIPVENLLRTIEIALAECRRRTALLVDLVEGESVELRLVNNRPWGGYNWYKGNAHSLVETNTDLPVNALDVLGLMAHEAYPGHHTEHSLKEKHLYQDCGYGELASALLYSPSAVIAEGIATTALEIIFPTQTSHEWIASELLPAAGLPSIDPDQLRRIATAREALRWVSPNAAILYHTGELDEAQTLDYLRAYLMVSDKRVERTFGFMKHYRSYVFTYTDGYTLIEQGARGGDKTPLFKRLLREEVLPSRIPSLM